MSLQVQPVVTLWLRCGYAVMLKAHDQLPTRLDRRRQAVEIVARSRASIDVYISTLTLGITRPRIFNLHHQRTTRSTSPSIVTASQMALLAALDASSVDVGHRFVHGVSASDCS